MSVFRSGWRSFTHSSPRRAVALQLIRVDHVAERERADVGELDPVAAAARDLVARVRLRVARAEQLAQLLLPREDA